MSWACPYELLLNKVGGGTCLLSGVAVFLALEELLACWMVPPVDQCPTLYSGLLCVLIS